MSNYHFEDDALKALSDAALAIASNLALDKVLRQIVESARLLVGAQYAALGVPNTEGLLVEFVHSGMEPGLVNSIGRLPRGLGLLGAIMQGKEPIRLDRLTEDPRSVGFPKGHPPMESFLGVPIRGGDIRGGRIRDGGNRDGGNRDGDNRDGDNILGNLYLTNKEGGESFSEADQALIELLATHAAIAIQNARLYEQVGRMAVVEERSRIGMDLHDGIIQAVYAVGLTLESTRLLLPEEEAEATGLIDRAIDGLNDAIGDIRNFILDLRPRRFEGNLSRGLERLAREFQANTMVPVSIRFPDLVATPFPPDVARAMFLTAQEALANVARHARADRVMIRLERRDNLYIMHVRDDGVGFDTNNQYLMTGHGLANMRARAEELEGTVRIESQPGEGTAIFFELPAPN